MRLVVQTDTLIIVFYYHDKLTPLKSPCWDDKALRWSVYSCILWN